MERKEKSKIWDLSEQYAYMISLAGENNAVLWAQQAIPAQLYPQVASLAREVINGQK